MKAAVSAVLLSVLAVGCATKDYVNERVSTEGLRLESSIKSLDSAVRAQESRQAATEGELANTSKLAQEALDRANAAQKLAEGKMVFEAVLSDDQIKFKTGKSSLAPEVQGALTEFVNKLKTDNRSVYIEIQGHTDSTGSHAGNKVLGLQRAEAVRDYLHEAGVPLHRMNVVSYGDARPAVKSSKRADRAQNRRVVLVVLV